MEKEGWAIVLTLKKFRQYLLGAPFTVFTDHKPLRSLFSSEFKNARVQRWGILISEYNCKIQYREGKKMKADFVSRIRGPAPTDNYAQEAAEEGLCFDYPMGESQEGLGEDAKDPRFWPFTEHQGLDMEEEQMEVSEMSERAPMGPPTDDHTDIHHEPSPVVLHDEAGTDLQDGTDAKTKSLKDLNGPQAK